VNYVDNGCWFSAAEIGSFLFLKGAVWLELYGFAGAAGMVDFAEVKKVWD
jgi:hypothetical protein